MPERRGLLRSLIESTAVGLAVLLGDDFTYELVNPAYRELAPFRQMLGRRFEAVWPEAAGRILPIFRRVVRSGEPFEAVDMRVDIQRAAGGPIEESYFSFGCRRLPGSPGEPAAVLVHVLDTTRLVLARRRAEDRAQRRGAQCAAEHGAREQAEQARDRLEVLARLVAEVNEGADLEAVVGSVLRLSARALDADDGVLRLIEEGGSSLRTFAEVRELGRTGEALPLDRLPHSREAAATRRAVHVTVDEAEAAERELFRRAGHASVLILPLTLDRICFGLVHVGWTARAAHPPAQDLAFVRAMTDQCALAITRAWVLESEKAARLAAEGLSRRQEMLSAILAHDLRNPIDAIAVTSMALVQGDGLDERQRDAVGRIATLAARMGSLVDELLDYARARQAGGIPVARERADIGLVCARAIRQQLDAHPGGRVDFGQSGPGEGLWDPSRLEQVVANLVGNALERSPAGAAVEVRAAATAEELVLTVRNEGPAIPPEVRASLFDPFRRGDDRGRLGLGLFIVSEIVRAHGGDIGVTSGGAEGTRFTVRLPRSGREA